MTPIDVVKQALEKQREMQVMADTVTRHFDMLKKSQGLQASNITMNDDGSFNVSITPLQPVTSISVNLKVDK